MAEVKGSDIPAEQQAFSLCWNLLKKYYKAASVDDWQAFIMESESVQKQLQGTMAAVLCEDMIVAIMNHVERINKV